MKDIKTAEDLVDLLEIRHHTGAGVELGLYRLVELLDRLGEAALAAELDHARRTVEKVRILARDAMPWEEIPGVEEEKQRRGFAVPDDRDED